MNKITRTKTVYLNSVVTLIGQILQVFFGFIIRKIFIDSLGLEYLGYNSVFLNVLQMLNLADLGIGVAITSFLYKPLAVGDHKRVATLMYMYKLVYQVLGVFVLISGVIFSFFLQYLIPDAMCGIWYLRCLFLINLANSVSTYYLAYKRTLLIADQKSYIASLVDSLSYVVMSLCQATILLLCSNYIFYLIISVVKNVVSNIIISIRSDKMYENYGKDIDIKILNEYKPQVISYVKDVFVSRIGAYIYYCTDNIIISIFKGSLLTGYLSNYTLITTQVNNIITQILLSIQATFGNYISLNDDISQQKKMTDNYICVNFLIGNFCMICMVFLMEPFIQLVFGKKFVLGIFTTLLLSVNLLLTIMIQIPSQVFMIYKLFRYDRPIIIISASMNIIVSMVLVKKIGINGALIGTFITSLFYLFSRFYIISRYVYYISYWKYIISIFKYGCITLISFVMGYVIVRNISGASINLFIIRLILVVVTSITIPIACLFWTNEFEFLKNKLLPDKIKKYFSKYMIGGISIILTILLVLIGEYK